jgi:hypothetical protein
MILRKFILGHIGIGHCFISVEFPKQDSPPYNGWLQLRDLADVTFPHPVRHSDQGPQIDQNPFTESKAISLISSKKINF